jgi:hypothetical protein
MPANPSLVAALNADITAAQARIALNPPAPVLAVLQAQITADQAAIIEANASPGSATANHDALLTRCTQTITDCNTAETLINANGWDGLTPAQRKAIAVGIVQSIRAQAHLNLSQYDAPA